MAKQIDELNKIITKYDKDGLLIGEAACTNDLVNITTVDFQVVNAISIVAIFIIIAIVEKSITLPIILVAVIELAIFINLGIPHLMGESLPFITPICISTIQLGATVDYAILMTTRYKKERYLGNDKRTSVITALETSIPSIIVSAMGLFAATIGVAFYSDVDLISSICKLLARGAVISMFCVTLILPAMFMLFDKVIAKTTLGFKPKKHQFRRLLYNEKNNKNNNHKFLSKNYIKGAISGALALTILCSGVGVAAYSAGADNTAQALGVQTESTVEAVKKASTTKEALKKLSKNETVYVIADASGAAKKIIVSDWLKGVDTKGKVKDVSNLKNVKNVKGDETYTVNENNAYEWAANGDDIYYQGTGTTELPVKLKLSYKLNGKTVSADEIAGKSGKVTIRIDYENTQKEKVKINGKTEEVNVPFLMLSGMILDDDNFKNVEVSNGKAINDGTRTIVAGFALPGMQDSLDIDKDEMEIPDYVEITADTTDFELSTTMTVAMNDIFNDVDFQRLTIRLTSLRILLMNSKTPQNSLLTVLHSFMTVSAHFLTSQAHSLKVLTSFMTVQNR